MNGKQREKDTWVIASPQDCGGAPTEPYNRAGEETPAVTASTEHPMRIRALSFSYCPPSISIFLCALGPAAAEDAVLLDDGSSQRGQVIELGGNKIELGVQGGTRKIWKREIQKVTFDESRHSSTVETTDVVVKQGGHRMRGKVDLLDNGQKVQVTFPGGARAVLHRKDVIRIIRGGETVQEDASVYTVELAESVEKALESLEGPGSPSEKLLAAAGIFAIDRVRRDLARAEPGSPREKSLRRLDRLYRLKQVVPDAIEDAEGRVYEIFTDGSAKEKCDLFLLVFPRHVDESVPLASFLAKDPDEDAVVRAWSIDFLRRMQRNRELVEIYGASTGAEQLAAAIALARNRVFYGMPTLIEALELDSVDMRKLAARQIRDVAEQDFGYRADGAPLARKEAVARIRGWWQENEEAFREMAENVLRKNTADTPERKAALQLWREAAIALEDKQDLKGCEEFLRKATLMDPTFTQAHVRLASLLYGELGRPAEALRLLEDLKARRTADLTSEERQWIYLHLANAARLEGDHEKASSAYAQCRLIAPDNVDAIIGAADIDYFQATGKEGLQPEVRQQYLKAALASYTAAAEVLERTGGNLSTLRFEDIPDSVQPAFDRRDYNRSVVELRRSLRVRRYEALFKSAKTRSLLGDAREAMLILRRAAVDLGLEPTDRSKKLEAEVRCFLGLLYEGAGENLLALKEYRKVIRDIDPSNEACKKAVDRLKRTAGVADVPESETPPRSGDSPRKPGSRKE